MALTTRYRYSQAPVDVYPFQPSHHGRRWQIREDVEAIEWEDSQLDELGPEWCDSIKEARETPDAGLSLDSHDSELMRWSKTALEQAARDELGIELDRRKNKSALVQEIREAQQGPDW